MYRIEDKAAAIGEVQRLLHLNQTRIFEKNTRYAVAEHQKANRLEPTGIVDYPTFISIVKHYTSMVDSEISSQSMVAASDFPINPGAQGIGVEYINSLLENIILEYRLDLHRPRGRYFGYDTSATIYAVQRIFDMPSEEAITASLYNRMLIENEAISIKKQFR